MKDKRIQNLETQVQRLEAENKKLRGSPYCPECGHCGEIMCCGNLCEMTRCKYPHVTKEFGQLVDEHDRMYQALEKIKKQSTIEDPAMLKHFGVTERLQACLDHALRVLSTIQ